jgi:hypothetical protein
MKIINFYCLNVDGECILPFVSTIIINFHYILTIILILGIIVYYNKKRKSKEEGEGK